MGLTATVIAWICLGIATAIAAMILPFPRGLVGVFLNVGLGISGAVAGGLIGMSLLPTYRSGLYSTFSTAFLGAFVLLLVGHAIWRAYDSIPRRAQTRRPPEAPDQELIAIREGSASLARQPGATASAASMFARILVPIDFSDGARNAMLFALDVLRRMPGSRIIAMSVTSLGENTSFLAALGSRADLRDVIREEEEHLRRYVQELGGPAGANAIACRAVLDDKVVRPIARAAAEYDATVVVYPVDPPARRGLFRSRVQRLVAAVDCPVLLVPA